METQQPGSGDQSRQQPQDPNRPRQQDQQGQNEGANRQPGFAQQEQEGGDDDIESGRGPQVAKEDGITDEDIEAGNDLNQPGQLGNQDRVEDGSTRTRNP